MFHFIGCIPLIVFSKICTVIFNLNLKKRMLMITTKKHFKQVLFICFIFQYQIFLMDLILVPLHFLAFSASKKHILYVIAT